MQCEEKTAVPVHQRFQLYGKMIHRFDRANQTTSITPRIVRPQLKGQYLKNLSQATQAFGFDSVVSVMGSVCVGCPFATCRTQIAGVSLKLSSLFRR
eukprot:s2040_g12.t1